MDKSTKAALYSALLFPGWGQFYLKCYKRGLVFFLPVLMGSIALAWSVVRAGSAIIQAAPFKKGTVQVADIVLVSADALKAVDLSYLLMMLLLVAALWILSIVDAYQLGKKMVTISTTGGNPQ